jgi:prefoldin subunit 5
MNKEELQEIYEQLEAASAQLEAIAKVLTEIREKLASGGGPGEEKH